MNDRPESNLERAKRLTQELVDEGQLYPWVMGDEAQRDRFNQARDCRSCFSCSRGEAVSKTENPAPMSNLDPTDFQLLYQLDRDNIAGGARPVIESQGWEQARRLSDEGLIAIENVGLGGRLHITRKGMKVLSSLIHEDPAPQSKDDVPAAPEKPQ